MAHRRANGEGTIYRRRDGRFEGAAYFLTTGGTRKRISVYGRTRNDVHSQLTQAIVQAQRGIPIADRAWKLDDYLDYWLASVIRPNRRPATSEQYAWAISRYLKPGLGNYSLKRLSVPIVQTFLNQKIDEGHSVRKVHIIRMVLSSALGRALREELVGRNVARLVELPTYERTEIHPWSADESKQFLAAARTDPLYSGFVLLMLYGLRRGEVLGLRWGDVDFTSGEIHVRNQLQRVGGQLHQGPVKTRAGQRNLPLLNLAREVLTAHRARQDAARASTGVDWAGSGGEDELVLTTRTGNPIEPRNFVRSFHRICEQNNIRVIKVHHVRHTAATMLKNLGVPARDAQLILGHSQISITQEIYQHDDMGTRRQSLERVEELFAGVAKYTRALAGSSRCRQLLPSGRSMVDKITMIISGTPGKIRTCDHLVRSLAQPSIAQRRQSVDCVLRGFRRQWLLGLVAVKFSRQEFFRSSDWCDITLPKRAGTDS